MTGVLTRILSRTRAIRCIRQGHLVVVEARVVGISTSASSLERLSWCIGQVAMRLGLVLSLVLGLPLA